jgi:hypothetical protein
VSLQNAAIKDLKKPDTLHIGDFVYCRSKYHRDQLELPERELGLVIEIKRNNIKILYAGDRRCWLPKDVAARIKPDLDYSTFLEKLHYLIKKVHAQECEVISLDAVHTISLRIDQMSCETIDDIRRFLGPDFISLIVVPEGMVFMQVEIRFRGHLPAD